MGWEAVGLSLSLRGATFARSNDRGLSPAPEGAPPIAAPAGRPKGRWILVREVSPYSSLLGRYPFGRGVWGRRSRFRTPLKFRYPAPRGNASEAPKSRLNCASPSARRRWRWAVRLRNGFSVGTGATRAARQHPSGTALATLLRKATLRVGGYAFGGALRAVHMPKTERGGFLPSKLGEKLHPA